MKLTSRHVLACLAATLSSATCSSIASAHDVWLTTTGDGNTRRVVVNYGHPNDRPPTSADKVLDLIAISTEGQQSLRDGLAFAQVEGVPVAESQPFIDAGHTLIAARYDNGYWVKVADNLYRNASRRLAPDALDSIWSVKFAKSVTGPGAPWDKVLSHEFEIVPLTDPATVKPGETLRVRVLFRGKPLESGDVERGDGITPMAEQDIPRFKTDQEGIAAIPLVKSGPHLLAIDYRVAPSGTPQLAAADLYNATLWFFVGPPAGAR